MDSSSWVLRVDKDRRQSINARKDAERHLERVRDAAELIRRMTEIYRERLDGNTRVQR